MDLVATTVTGSDDWWLMRLAQGLGAGFPRLAKLRSYATGEAPVPLDSAKPTRAAYARFVRRCRLNMADLITGARVSRMKPLGFRTAAPDDDFGDRQAWSTWKRSHMKVGFRDLVRDLGNYGTAYCTTTGSASLDSPPLLLRSNGWTTITEQWAYQPWEARTALVIGHDPIAGKDVLTLFGQGWMRTASRAARTATIPQDGSVWAPGRGWSWEGDRVPLGYTQLNPVVRYDTAGGRGLFENHLDSLDRINATILDRLTITAMQAFRQRAIEGNLPRTYPDEHPQAGQVIDYDAIYSAGPAALWPLPAGAKVWESAVTDIRPILDAIKDDVRQLAAVSSTALYILSPDIAQGSASGADLAREALNFSVDELRDRVDERLAANLSLAFQAQGDEVRAEVGQIDTIWASIDGTSITGRAAASQQAKAGGMTQRMIDEKVFGYSPEEMEQAANDRQAEQFALAAAPTPAGS